MSFKRIFFGVLRLLIAFFLLYYLFNKVSISEIIASIANASSSGANYLIGAFALSIISQIVLAYRLKFLADKQGMCLSAFSILKINLATIFYGLFLPGGNITSGAIRFYKLSTPSKKKAQALASLLYDRIIATVTVCVVGLLFWLVDFSLVSDYHATFMIIVLGGLLLFLILVLSHDNQISLLGLIKSTGISIVYQKVQNLFLALDRYKSLSFNSLAYIFALSLTVNILGILIFYLLAMLLGINIPFISMGWIRSVVIVVTMIPVAISGLGIREGVLLLLLKPYGVIGVDALALSLLIFGVTLFFNGLLGGFLEGTEFITFANKGAVGKV